MSALVLGIVLCSPAPSSAQQIDALGAARVLEQTLVEAIADAERSIVSIARIKRPKQSLTAPQLEPLGFDFPQRNGGRDVNDPESLQFVPSEFGTGIVILPDPTKRESVILTNYHVVKGGPPVTDNGEVTDYILYVRFSDRRGYWASILAADPRSDLAVLKIDLEELGITADRLHPLRIGDASNVRKGQIVLALGNPYAVAREGSASASWGMISNIARRPAAPSAGSDIDAATDETIHHYGTLLQVDTRLNLGTSGGALLNLEGELIGVTTALAALEGYETSVGYAIPMNAAMRRVIDSLVHGHEVEYGFLGVVPRTTLLKDMRNKPDNIKQASAARIESVMLNSPASDGGLRQGDIILEVNGITVFDHFDLMREVGGLGPGAIARLWIWREHQQDKSTNEHLKTTTLGKWPAVNEDDIIATNHRFPPWRGLWIDYPTGRERFTDPYSYLRAVAVAKVESGSVAAAAGLRQSEFIRQVNATPISTPAGFYRAVDGLLGDVTLQVDDGRGNIRRVVVGR